MAAASQAGGQVTLILGIPVDDLSLDSAIEQTLGLAADYRRDGRPRQVVTVNVDFLTNALGWTPWSAPRHPELLEILRRADLVTADGMPVVWLARLLGSPLRSRVTGADLVPALAAAMRDGGQSLFLLGGRGDIGQQAADKLLADHPGLRIAGVYSPFVHTEGEAMLLSEADDAEIVSRINAASPDVLLIAFGNPKQEIWFHRNRHRLRAGVSIGIGGTFEFIVGRVARAPLWMQRTGLEWIWRITQDPKRLWKRYAVGFAKLAVMSVPMVLQYRLQRWRVRHRLPASGADTAAATPTRPAAPSAIAREAEAVIVLPEVADADWVRGQQQDAVWDAEPGVVLDFTATRFLDSTALGHLVRRWKARQNARQAVRAVGLEGSEVVSLLKMTRTWDLFIEGAVGRWPAADAAAAGASPPAPERSASGPPSGAAEPLVDGISVLQMTEALAIASLDGRLDADRCASIDLTTLVTRLGPRDLVLDLSDLSFVDSTGLGLLFRMQRELEQADRRLVLCGMRPVVRQLMEITRLTRFFRQASTRADAVKLLGQGAAA